MATKLKAINGGKQAKQVEVKEDTKLLKSQAAEDDVFDEQDQPIREVSQTELKKAMKLLLTKQSSIMELLYTKHAEYNEQYFRGELSIPLITIEKLDNRTLANYTYSGNAIPIDNHIRFNQNFIALNQGEDGTCERILETLKHEMIHQWQDQVIYHQVGETPKTVVIPLMSEDGVVTEVSVLQKKMPKDRHNKDFKDMAKVVGIPAIGAKCYGNPAIMPEPKSYNRKFACGCIASNGYPVTVWSTREVKAKCTVCGNEFKEHKKKNRKAKTIAVNTSHVEKEGQDAIQDSMKEKYNSFIRFQTRGAKDEFMLELQDGKKVKLEEGIYQKGHNAYGLGFRYWVAYNASEVQKVEKPKKAAVIEKPAKPEKQEKVAKSKPKLKVVKPQEETNKKGTDDMKKMEDRTYDPNNPQDLLDVYREMGTTRKAAEVLGIGQSTFVVRSKKFQIDFKKGTFVIPE